MIKCLQGLQLFFFVITKSLVIYASIYGDIHQVFVNNRFFQKVHERYTLSVLCIYVFACFTATPTTEEQKKSLLQAQNYLCLLTFN